MAKQMNRGERFVFNETHLQKIFFPILKNYEIKLKKERTSKQCTEFVKKNQKRPILRGKIVLMIFFIRSHFVIDRPCTTIKLHISSAS